MLIVFVEAVSGASPGPHPSAYWPAGAATSESARKFS
jgi:hypothetical protein